MPADVEALIGQAAARLDAAGPPEVDLDAVTAALNEGRATNALFEEMGRTGSAHVDHTVAVTAAAEALLREAAGRLGTARPGLTPYAARRRVVADLQTRYPRHAEFRLAPEPRLAPGDPTPCPPLDERYRHFFAPPAHYWRDPLYEALVARPPDQLPDGAMLALCPLAAVSTHMLARGDDDGEPVTTLITRYGGRFAGPAIEYLGHPGRYGWDASIGRNVMATRWFPPLTGHGILQAAGAWPGDSAAPLFRLALEAGWNYAGGLLPDAAWAHAVHAEFADSPYGPPDRPSWMRR